MLVSNLRRIQVNRLISYAIASLMCTSTLAATAEETKSEAQQKSTCKISCLDPHPCCPESQKVIELLNVLAKAYSDGDIKTYEKYLDDNCTTFDESKHKLVIGKEKVLSDLMRKFEDYGPSGKQPLISFTIDQPYAKMTGEDTCVVTFIAQRELGGTHPIKERSNTTDIFVKKDGQWKKLHYRSHWKKVH